MYNVGKESSGSFGVKTFFDNKSVLADTLNTPFFDFPRSFL